MFLVLEVFVVVLTAMDFKLLQLVCLSKSEEVRMTFVTKFVTSLLKNALVMMFGLKVVFARYLVPTLLLKMLKQQTIS